MTKALPNGKTPFEMVYGRKPDLGSLKEWGCWVWVHDKSGSKLDGRSQVGWWVGYDSESTGAHRIYWGHGRVSIECDVKFSNDDVPILNAVTFKGEKGLNKCEIVQNQSPDDETNKEDSPKPEPPNDDPPQQPEIQQNSSPADEWLGKPFNWTVDSLVTTREWRIPKKSEYVKSIERGEGTANNRPSKPDLPAGIQIPPSMCEIEEIEGELPVPEAVKSAMATAVSDAEALEPKTIGKAKKHLDWPKWKAAIQAELDTLTKMKTWQVVERPKGRNVIQCKWVFKIKKDAEGKIERYKACLVTKGFTQVENIDYYETWAPVAKLASIHTILALATHHDWDIDMFDFHNAFLNRELNDNKEVYMEQPPGHEDRDPCNFCLQLKKSLYGLKQAGRKWYNVVCQTFADLGFKKSKYDPAVFYIHSGDNIIIMAIHVDDCTITGNNRVLLKEIKRKMKSRYSLTDLGPVNWLLGIKITRDQAARMISLSQESYIDSILARFNLTDAKPMSTPMDPLMRFSKDQSPQTLEEMAEMRNVPYQEGTGSLQYCAIATRPDIAFSVSLLSQYNKNPGQIHWEAVKRVLHYLKATKGWKLVYGTEQDNSKGFMDADGASQEHRHAISAYVFMIDGGAVSWSSKKQELVTLSTAESEYVAATYAAKEALWARRFVSKVFSPITKPLTLYCDSQSAIALTKGWLVSCSHEAYWYQVSFYSIYHQGRAYSTRLLPYWRYDSQHTHQSPPKHQGQTFCHSSRPSLDLKGEC